MNAERALMLPFGCPVRIKPADEVIEVQSAEVAKNPHGKDTVWLTDLNDDGELVRVRARDVELWWGDDETPEPL